jgi:hypothetical protein
VEARPCGIVQDPKSRQVIHDHEFPCVPPIEIYVIHLNSAQKHNLVAGELMNYHSEGMDFIDFQSARIITTSAFKKSVPIQRHSEDSDMDSNSDCQHRCGIGQESGLSGKNASCTPSKAPILSH